MGELDHAEKSTGKENTAPVAHTNLLDLQKDNTLRLSKSNLMPAAGEQEGFIPLDAYILMREKVKEDQSYFKTATTFLTRAGRRITGTKDASDEFESAEKSGNQIAMMHLLHEDRKQLQAEDKIANYSATALKMGFLFAGGKVGFAGLAGVNTTDQAKPADPFDKQMTDVALGAAKSIATRYIFGKINDLPINPVTKGFAFGLSDRLLEVGLNRQTFTGADGNIDLLGGAKKTGLSVFGPQALIADAGTGAFSHLALLPINYYTGGKFFANPIASRLTMAGVAGGTEGALKDLNFQQESGRPIDWLQVARSSGEHAAMSTVSALPGAIYKIAKPPGL